MHYQTIRNNQQYALILTTPLFCVLAPTCFGSSLQSSGSFLDPPDLLEIEIEWVVYHIMCGYVACVPDFRGSVSPNRVIYIYIVKGNFFSIYMFQYLLHRAGILS
jgi:hypothetical protein